MNFSSSPFFSFILVTAFVFYISFAGLTWAATSVSFYQERLNDPKAVYLSAEEFGAHGDGVRDDTDAIQKAINHVVEKTTDGILFVPEGKYRISRTLHIWAGIRVIGYGHERPHFILGENAAGFQSGVNYMVYFAGNLPGHHDHDGFQFLTPDHPETKAISFDEPVHDANPGTFYSAMSNIDMEIGAGNPGAACVRAHYAQHCFVAHMNFDIGSGLAGIYDGGNVGEDLHFSGGQYGIITHKTSPGWQFCLVDTSFENQTEAAIKTAQAGLTLIRPQFKHVPTAISIDPEMAEELWMKDGRMDDISGPALIISDEQSARTQINLENVVCRKVPHIAQFRESGKRVEEKHDIFTINHFFHGLLLSYPSGKQGVTTQIDTAAQTQWPAALPSDIPALPAQKEWANVHDLGVKGDGLTDDTAALRRAVDGHRALYFPCGAYLVSDTIHLKPDSVLIGLHPSASRLFLAENTPTFADKGGPVPLLEAPAGGAVIITGLGLSTNAINPRAVALKWMSGKNSLVNDVRFLGGHGTSQISGPSERVYNKTHTGDPDPLRKWDVQYPSLWITDGGGGTFMDIWTPNTFAQAGLRISNTTTEGRIYELSSEHHVSHEIQLDHVENWQLCALQMEEERGESAHTLPLEIKASKNLTFANMFIYRVVSSDQPASCAIQVSESENLRFRNIHCFSDSRVSFENLLCDKENKIQVRQREVGSLNYFVPDEAKDSILSKSTELKLTAPVEKIVDGFSRISGLTVDAQGRVYFVDVPTQRICRWDPVNKKLSVISDHALQPINLAMDRTGNLLVISYTDTVYELDPNHPEKVTALKPLPTSAHAGADVVLPLNLWRNETDFTKVVVEKKPDQIISTDGSTVIPAENDFITGRLYYGAKMHDLLRAFGLQKVMKGQSVYITDENEEKTYTASLDDEGTLSSLKLFVEDGGESLATDTQGNVYIANGDIKVYRPDGEFMGVIPVPERPLSLAFDKSNPQTLYIATGTALYRVNP